MFNYASLNDVEFEELCRDVMQRKLNLKLRTYSSGKDGGIDFADDEFPHKIIVQVKHYTKSSFSSLRNTLKNELVKVNKKNPEKYFVCTSKELTNSNIEEIFTIFKDYMESSKNIITLKEIDSFLQEEKNGDIVRKHYKLWLHASGILNQINNNASFIDCESLLASIDEEKEYFVQTKIYNKSILYLRKERILMLVGPPGVGKTATSKMLILYLVSMGYRARYTSNGNLTDVKKSLSVDKDLREVILLDDCLGQHYFKMGENIESELMSLINYVRMNPQKILIMNSRVTIYNEAKANFIELGDLFEDNKIKQYVLDLNELDDLDKAKIFYNHLYAKKIPERYFLEIKKDNLFRNIIEHPNYTPRIIEYITKERVLKSVNEKNYYNLVIEHLNFPDRIWENEFSKRIEAIDRHFMLVLYSLTDTVVDYQVLKRCFEKRISGINNLDTSLNHFELVLSRLNGSMITIFDSKGNKVIGVSNPSVNDYLRKIFYDNQVELERIKESILHFEQIFRCYNQEDANIILKKMLLNEKILELEFDSLAVKTYILSVLATKNRVMKPGYQVYVDNFLTNYESKIAHLYSKQDMLSDIFMTLLEEDLYQYYNISKYLSNRDKLKQIINKIELEDLSTIVNRLWKELHEKRVMHLGNIKDYLAFFNETILEKISDWMLNLSITEILDNTDMEDVVNDNKEINSDGEVEYDEYEIEEEAKNQIKQYCTDEITNYLKSIKFINWEQVEDTIEKSDILDIDFDDIVVEIYDDSDDEELYTPELLKEDRARLEAQESLNYQDEIDSIFDR